jgi:hypothetical protein
MTGINQRLMVMENDLAALRKLLEKMSTDGDQK